MRELAEVKSSTAKRTYLNLSFWTTHDKNHDRKLNQLELESMLNQTTRNSIFALRPRQQGIPPFIPSGVTDWNSEKTKALYKAAVETIWRTPLEKPSAGK